MSRSIVARVLAVGAVGAGVAALVGAHAPSLSRSEPQTFEIDPPAAVVGCPGEQQVPVGNVGTGGDLASEPTDRTFRVYAPGEQRQADAGVAVDAAVAGQFERIGDGDIAGWSALTCAPPEADQWLVGGSTALGASARLVLTNPSAAPTEATVTVYGPLGVVEDTAVIPVAAGGQADRLLEGVAASQAALVVRVQATGPGVSAALQDSRLEGFQPAGTAWIGGSDLAEHLVVPAVGFSRPDATVLVRLMAPEGASVTLTLVSEAGVEPWSTGSALTLEPGVVTDIAVPVNTLGAIEVDADAPVLAAGRTVERRTAAEGSEGDEAADQTWVPGMTVDDATRAAVMPAQGARIAVYSPYATTVTFSTADGTAVASKAIDARTVQWVDLDVPAGTVVTATAQVAWAFVATSDDGFMASASPVVLDAGTLSATVVARPYLPGS